MALSASKTEASMSAMHEQISASQAPGPSPDALSHEPQPRKAGQATLKSYGLALPQASVEHALLPPAAVRASSANTSDCLDERGCSQEKKRGAHELEQGSQPAQGGHALAADMADGAEGNVPAQGVVDSQKINMLLAHPVVVKAMQNPHLDAILSRLLGILHARPHAQRVRTSLKRLRISCPLLCHATRTTAILHLRLKRNPDVVLVLNVQQAVILGTSNSWQSTGRIRKWWSCTRQ